MHLQHHPHDPAGPLISFEDFLKVDIRCGTIIKVENFPEARKPAFKLHIDFGPGVGIKKSSAQITANYSAAELLHKKVAAVVNFPSRQVGPFLSEVLVVGFADQGGEVVLLDLDEKLSNGSRLF